MSDKPTMYLPHHIELDQHGLIVDGVRLPWLIGEDIEVTDLSGEGKFWALEVLLPADRITVTAPGRNFDSAREGARQEALRIVREGLHDVLMWLGEERSVRAH